MTSKERKQVICNSLDLLGIRVNWESHEGEAASIKMWDWDNSMPITVMYDPQKTSLMGFLRLYNAAYLEYVEEHDQGEFFWSVPTMMLAHCFFGED